MDLSGQPTVARASGAAQRRRLRRLRAALRHEQQSIAMALASALHHSADKTTRAQYNAPRGQKNAGTVLTRTWCLRGVPGHPVWVSRGGAQERDQQRTVEQIAVYAPMVQILDAPVAQMVEQLPNLVQFFDILRPDPEPVIEVPKILPYDVPLRRLCRDTQLAEQLAEVPTILYFLKHRIPKQIVDNPVPHGGRGVSGGLHGFLPGYVEQTVDFPAPCSSVRRLQGFLPEQSSTVTSSSSSATTDGAAVVGLGVVAF